MRNDPVAVSLASLLLAACSGAGGGGMAAAPAPAPATPTAATTGTPVNLQAASTTVIYQAAAATTAVNGSGGAATTAPGQGATVTLTTDGSGYLKTLSFNMPGFTGSVPGPSISLASTFSANAVAEVLTNNYDPNSFGHVISQVAAGGQVLSSSAYGLWIYTDAAKFAHLGSFAFGNLTSAASVPVTGSATFNGFTAGANSVASGGSVYALQGNVQIIANFSAQTVTTNLTNLIFGNAPYTSAPPGVTTLPDLTGTSSITGNSYAGPISGGALTGTINGNFYGSAGQETAGVWQASGGGNAWIGSFGAK